MNTAQQLRSHLQQNARTAAYIGFVLACWLVGFAMIYVIAALLGDDWSSWRSPLQVVGIMGGFIPGFLFLAWLFVTTHGFLPQYYAYQASKRQSDMLATVSIVKTEDFDEDAGLIVRHHATVKLNHTQWRFQVNDLCAFECTNMSCTVWLRSAKQIPALVCASNGQFLYPLTWPQRNP